MGLDGRANRGEYFASGSVCHGCESLAKLVKIERLAAGILCFYDSVAKQEHEISWRQPQAALIVALLWEEPERQSAGTGQFRNCSVGRSPQ